LLLHRHTATTQAGQAGTWNVVPCPQAIICPQCAMIYLVDAVFLWLLCLLPAGAACAHHRHMEAAQLRPAAVPADSRCWCTWQQRAGWWLESGQKEAVHTQGGWLARSLYQSALVAYHVLLWPMGNSSRSAAHARAYIA
jgi:hypothetical protein